MLKKFWYMLQKQSNFFWKRMNHMAYITTNMYIISLFSLYCVWLIKHRKNVSTWTNYSTKRKYSSNYLWIIRSIYWRSYSNKIQELVWGYMWIILLVTSRTKEDKSTTSTKEPEELKSKEPVQNSTPTSSEAWIAKNPEIFFF